MLPGDPKALGRRVAFHRNRRGISQRELGARIDRSESWVSQVERGARQIDRMSVLEALADALKVSIAELAPESNVVAAATQKPRAANTLSLALSSSDALGAVLSDSIPVDVEKLGSDAVRAWDFVHDARYEDLSSLLSTLIPELEYAARKTSGLDKRRVCMAKAKAYHAAAGVLSKLGETAAAWVAVDRAITAAEEADDPLLMAEGAFRLSIVFQGARRFDLAVRTAETAAQALGRLVDVGEAEAVALRGALFLQLAVASARSNDGEKAYDYLEKARAASVQLGADRNDYNTEFGPTNVLLHEVSLAVELGDAGHALRVAEKADTARLSPERQSRLLIDLARAHAQRRQPDAMVAALRQAESITPEQVQGHPMVLELVQDALRADQSDNAELHKLADDLEIQI